MTGASSLSSSVLGSRVPHPAETEDEKHRRLLDALRTRLADLQSAAAAGTSPPALAPEEEADEATREVLNDPAMIIGLISGAPTRGVLTGLFRIRVEDWRILYEHRPDGTIRVLRISHRSEAYRSDPR